VIRSSLATARAKSRTTAEEQTIGTSQWPTTRKPFSQIAHLPSYSPHIPSHSHSSHLISQFVCCAVVLCEVRRIQSTRKLNQGPRKSWHNLMSAQWETMGMGRDPCTVGLVAFYVSTTDSLQQL